MNGYKINDNLYINCDNIDYASFLNDKVKIHMNDNTSYYITQDQYADIETKIPQGGGSGGGSGGGGASITSNIKIVANKSSVLSSNHNKLCIVNDTSDLSFKVVDKIDGGIEEISLLNESLPKYIQMACCATYGDNIYIFGGGPNNIYKLNCINKTLSTLTVALPKNINDAECALYGDNVYIFGGDSSSYVNTIYKFNCITETITTLDVTLPKVLSSFTCSIYEDNVYIFGGVSANSSISSSILKFNCTKETISSLNVYLPKRLYGLGCSTYGNYIYIFGGNNESRVNAIFKFDCTKETISTLEITLPQALEYPICSIYGSDIYILGGRVNDTILGGLNTIFKFDCTKETISTLDITLPQTLYGSGCSIYRGDIYLFGGFGNSANVLKSIYKFSVSFDLPTNNVLLYCANSKFNFDLITDQVTIPISKIYIGDNNNTAQLCNAYLYDETKSAWVNVNTGEVLTA